MANGIVPLSSSAVQALSRSSQVVGNSSTPACSNSAVL
jgi:hypothetical protein